VGRRLALAHPGARARGGGTPGRALAGEACSPGEARKLLLAEGLARAVWLALLDEPTNHLDLPSIDRLTEALASFPGALVVATHDAHLADAVTATRWELRHGRVELT